MGNKKKKDKKTSKSAATTRLKANAFLPLSAELLAYSHRIAHVGEDPFLKRIEDVARTHPLGMMMGAKEEAKLLAMLCRMLNSQTVIEVGVFLGYTTLALAQALGENGRVIGLEINRDFVQLGEPAWYASGVSYKIDLRIGPARATMERLLDTHRNTVDLIFIDADKDNYSAYFALAQQLIRVGGVIAVDNSLWSGKVLLDDAAATPRTRALKRVNEVIANLDATHWCCVNLPMADGVTLVLRLK